MKKRKKLVVLLSSITLVLLTSVALTVAWFAEGSDLYVDNINLEFRGDKQLKISASEEISSFKDSISKSDLIQVDKFAPVTSMYSYKWMEEKSSLPQFMSGYNTSGEVPVSAIATSGFFSQEIYLYSPTDDFYATIDADSFELVSNKVKNDEIASTLEESFPKLTHKEILENLNIIEKSLRVSILVPHEDFYQYVIVDPYKSEETTFGGVMDLNGDGYFDNYSKYDVEYETVYGDFNDRNLFIYDSPRTSDSSLVGLETCFNARHKNHVKPFNLEASLSNGLEIAKEQSLTPSQAEEYLGIPVYADEPSKIVLSIYLEGWDLDNTNQAMYAAFSVSLKFKISEHKGGL